MLTEADLQELRGMAFDRLLLRVWPRGQTNYDNVLLAERIGVSLCTMRNWRNGLAVPRPATLRFAALSLELEFDVPKELWMSAVAISDYARGYVPPSSGARSIPSRSCARTYSESDIGRQYGYQVIIAPAGRNCRSQLAVRVRCLLCQSMRETFMSTLLGGAGSCKPCVGRLRGGRKNRSGFRGVWFDPHSALRPWIVDEKSAGVPGGKSFRYPIAAARYYDACTYDYYGHTLFLNFPDEYDRSNDPVFVPVSRPAACAASPEPVASAPTRRSPLPAGGAAQHQP